MIAKKQLSGTEEYNTLEEWCTDMADDCKMLMPGSKKMMKKAELKKDVITTQPLMSHSNALLVTSLSREPYSVLKRNTTRQARNQLNAHTENDGLEAWRLIRANLYRKDCQKLQAESDTLTTIAPIKINEFKNFPPFHMKWAAELVRFEALDADYRLGKFQKMSIIDRAVPKEITIYVFRN